LLLLARVIVDSLTRLRDAALVERPPVFVADPMLTAGIEVFINR